jgi:radical SAM protein with 4Fe4S-binding SPASM domain
MRNLSGDRFLMHKERLNFPARVHMDLTYRCNLKCVHCFQAKNKYREFTFKEIEDIFVQLKNAGCLQLIFSGGEPFLRKDFLEILDLADLYGFAIKIMSNGTLFDEKCVDTLKKIRLTYIQVSLYGITEKVHDFATAVPGSFVKTMQGLRLLRENNIKNIIAFLLMKQNCFQLNRLRSFSREHNLNIGLSCFVTPTCDRKLDPLKYRVTDRQVYDIMRFPRLKKSLIGGPKSGNNKTSKISKNFAYIAPNGEVYPQTNLRWSCGNLREKSFIDIWHNSSTLKTVRSLEIDDFECNNCKNLPRCRCYCPSLAYLEHGDLRKTPKEICRFINIGLKSGDN